MYSDWDEFGVLRELIGGTQTSLMTSWVKWLVFVCGTNFDQVWLVALLPQLPKWRQIQVCGITSDVSFYFLLRQPHYTAQASLELKIFIVKHSSTPGITNMYLYTWIKGCQFFTSLLRKFNNLVRAPTSWRKVLKGREEFVTYFHVVYCNKVWISDQWLLLRNCS